MDAFHIILTVLIILLLVDRQITHAKFVSFQEKMNRALIARTVPEYSHNTAGDLKKVKLENDLALGAAKLQDQEDDKHEPRYPVGA